MTLTVTVFITQFSHPKSLASYLGLQSLIQTDLHTVNGQVKAIFKEACVALGLLSNDNEWHQCLQKAGQMATGHQLQVLFVTILCDCIPSAPTQLWDNHKANICDDLQHALQHKNVWQNPTYEDVWDYGLYLIDQLLLNSNKSLKDWPDMPQVQQNWAAAVGNHLIVRESDYNAEKEAQEAADRIAQLTQDQCSTFDQIV